MGEATHVKCGLFLLGREIVIGYELVPYVHGPNHVTANLHSYFGLIACMLATSAFMSC